MHENPMGSAVMKVLCKNDVYEFHRALDHFWLGSADTNFVPRQEYVNFLLQQPRVIANLSTEHWGDGDYPMCQYMHEVMQTHPQLLILSHNPEHDLMRSNIRYFPFWLKKTREHLRENTTSFFSGQARFFLSCIAFRPRPHRIRMLRLLHETGFHKDAIIHLPRTQLEEDLHHERDQSFWKTHCTAVGKLEFDIWCTDWDAYTDAWLQVVLESSWQDGIFLTEKTWKCIATGQFFVLLSGRNSLAHMRSLGFDTFDDIIPHERYDGITGYPGRCDAIIDLLHHLRDLDWHQIYQDTAQRRQHNRDLFFSGACYQPYIQKLKNFFQL
jgi:hypothetical protein